MKTRIVKRTLIEQGKEDYIIFSPQYKEGWWTDWTDIGSSSTDLNYVKEIINSLIRERSKKIIKEYIQYP